MRLEKLRQRDDDVEVMVAAPVLPLSRAPRAQPAPLDQDQGEITQPGSAP
jgi:hypothetical protein